MRVVPGIFALLGAVACTSGKSAKDDSGGPIPSAGTTAGTPAGVTTGTPVTEIACPPGLAGPSLEATTGCYEGRRADGVEAFLGIGYAEPPVGDLRWARPVPIAPVADAVRPAKELGSPCIQANGTVDGQLAAGDGAEDCLYLNVLRPQGTQPSEGLPILFFVHGGGHVDGTGGSTGMVGASFSRLESDPPLFAEGPAVVAEQGAVVVTLNYRLAQLGWLGLPGLSAENADGASANQGLWDVVAALTWVRENAEAFGGDPDQLLLFGESAGSVATCSLLTAPAVDGMFSAALLQSGGCAHITSGLSTAPPLLESAYGQGGRLAQALSCDTAGDAAAVLACMRALPATDVMAVMQGKFGSLDLDDESYGPVVDGVLLPEPPGDRIEAGQIADVPVYIGVNQDEGTLFTTFFPIGGEPAFDAVLAAFALIKGWDAGELQDLYDPQLNYAGDVQAAYAAFYGDVAFVCPSRQLADQLSAHTDVRTYWWTHSNPFTAFLGAHHGVEISYVFGTGLTTGQQGVMIDVATTLWAQVPTGPPQVVGIGPWPLFGGSQGNGGTWVTLSAAPEVEAQGPRRSQCDWMDSQVGW